MIRSLLRHRAVIFLGLMLLVGAIGAQVVADRYETPGSEIVLYSRSAQPQGSLALALWLERLGHEVRYVEGMQAVPDSTIDVLFLLAPTQPFEQLDLMLLLEWVEDGGVLVYLPSPIRMTNPLSDMLAADLDREIDLGVSFGSRVEQAGPALPILTDLSASTFTVGTGNGLDLKNDAWVPLITGEGRVFAATRQFGQGRIEAISSERLLSNEGIGEADNLALVTNLLTRRPVGERKITVAFDEYHHGFVEAPDLLGLARRSPIGWAILYVVLIGFIFAFWGGRRFGPAVRPAQARGRSGGDYVTAFAGLLQRARADTWAQQEYVRQVRRALGRANGVRSDLPAEQLAQVVADRRPLDREALATQLSALDGPALGGRALLEQVRALELTLRSDSAESEPAEKR